MGLFKKNPAEKRLKELTGGIFLSGAFKNKLKNAGLTNADGFAIQNQIKEEIKTDKVQAEGIETRINYLIKQRSEPNKPQPNNVGNKPKRTTIIKDSTNKKRTTIIKNSTNKKSKPLKASDRSSQKDLSKNPRYFGNNVPKSNKEDKTSSGGVSTAQSDNKKSIGGIKIVDDDSKEVHILSQDSLEQMSNDDKVKKIKFLINQEHNTEKCPKCGATVLNTDKFCYKCGVDTISGRSLEELEKLSQDPFIKEEKAPEKSTEDQLSELEKLYNKKVSTKYDTKFKFAYVLYLEQINKKPNKKIADDKYLKLYDATVAKLKKQALEDEFLEEGNPLVAAKSATVKDIKEILKEHDLPVSGKKDDLIERLGENISEEELKKAFPKKVLSISDKGLEFIDKNRYVLYYDKASQVRTHIEVEEYDNVFEEKDNWSDEDIYSTLSQYLVKREDDLVGKKDWGAYRYNFMILARVYKDMGDDYNLLDMDFRLFIAGINSFSDYSNKSQPAYAYIGKTYSDELISLLHSLGLSIDELKDKFFTSYDELKYPDLRISKDESLVYLLKLFNGEDIQELTMEIRSKYPDENFRPF